MPMLATYGQLLGISADGRHPWAASMGGILMGGILMGGTKHAAAGSQAPQVLWHIYWHTR